MHKYAYSITRLRANGIPFYNYSATIAKAVPNNKLTCCHCRCRHNLCRRRTRCASLCTKQDAVAARLLRTRPASSIQGISLRTAVVPEQAPVHRGPTLVPHRDTMAARTTSRQVCACARLCLFACARVPELLQLQPNISTDFVSRGNRLISESTVGRGPRVAVTTGGVV